MTCRCTKDGVVLQTGCRKYKCATCRDDDVRVRPEYADFAGDSFECVGEFSCLSDMISAEQEVA